MSVENGQGGALSRRSELRHGQTTERLLRGPTARGPEAFGETTNPADYVPRPATESALALLEQSVRGARPAGISAAPGLGKTLLLRLLEQRLAGSFRCVFVPYGAIELEDLCAWVLGLLRKPASADSIRAIVEVTEDLSRVGSGLVVLIDDVNSMPIDTARRLAGLIERCDPNLRVVLGAGDDGASRRVLCALGPNLVEARLGEPMSPSETGTYLEARLESASLPPRLHDRFTDEKIAWIHRLSGGVPRRIHSLASSLLDEIPNDVTAVLAESDDNRWLGSPIDDFADDPQSEGNLLLETPGDSIDDGEKDELPEV